MLTVARFFGLHVAAVMMVQLVLVARLPWLDRRLGMDRLTAWHRWVGIALAWTIACHATFVRARLRAPGRRVRCPRRSSAWRA